MPGLVGIVHNASLSPELIQELARPMCHRPGDRVRALTRGSFAAAAIDLPGGARQHDLAQSHDGRFILLCFGAIYEANFPLDASVADVLLTRWLQRGASALTGLSGEYLIVVWDHVEQRLTIINDRLGLKRLQIWHDHTTFAYASELKSLAVLPEVSRETDEHALTELLSFGHLQDDRTLLREVRLLPPASVLTWHRGIQTITRYWDYAFQADAALADTGRAATEYAQRLQAAVERRLRGDRRVGLLLSGGLDSRTLAGMTRRVRPDDSLVTWTSGHAHAHDVHYGRLIARVIGSRHGTIDIPEEFLEVFGPSYAWLLDGMVSTHGAHRACVLDQVEQAADVLLIGYLGDHLSGGTPLDKVMELTETEALVARGHAIIETGFTDALFASTLRPAVYQRVQGLAREAYARTVREAHVEHPADRVVIADLKHRQRLWNPPALMDLLGTRTHVATPFADRDVVDFLLRLPVHQRLGKRAYLRMICQEFPQLARVPRSGDGLPLVHSRVRASLHWRWVHFQRETLPRMTGRRLTWHNRGIYAHCHEWFRTANRRFIETTLVNSPILEEYFKVEATNRLVRDFLNGTAGRDLMECIAALMSFVLFRQQLNALVPSTHRLEATCAAS